jgi:alkylated DNA repair dioxygenase AlkB
LEHTREEPVEERNDSATTESVRTIVSLSLDRTKLDATSWVDVGRSWLVPADATTLFEALRDGVAWNTSRLFRYDHWVEENRLGAMWRRGQPLPHPLLAQVHKSLEAEYGARFAGFSLLLYRNGRDGQAFHRDTDMRWLDDTVVAILTLGATRPWLMRPRSSRHSLRDDHGATHDLAPSNGDLIVMGGRCQADWEHSVPYLRRNVEPRISLQWRFARKVGRPFMGSGYGAPLTYRR